MKVEKIKPGSEREHEVMDKVATFMEIGLSGNDDLLERMAKAQRYACGDSWDPALKEYNSARGKFSLTIPVIRPHINQLVGSYIQNPKDPMVLNHRGGLKMLADLQTALVMHATKDESTQFELAQTISQFFTTGTSYMGVFLDYQRDPRHGDLEIKTLDGFDVLRDPTCKEYDWNNRRSGAKFVIWMPWVDKDWLAKQWPDQMGRYAMEASHISAGSAVERAAASHVGFVTGERMTSVGRAYGKNEDTEYSHLRERLVHTWWLEYREVYYFYDLQDERLEPKVLVDDKEKAYAKRAVKEFAGTFQVEKAVVPAMNHTRSVGNILLDNRFDEFNLLASGQTLFPVIPFNCYFNNGYVSGVAEDLEDSQDWINTLRSSVANVLKKQPNWGWIINSDKTGTYAGWLKDNASRDGVVLNKHKAGGSIESIPAVPIPMAAVQLTEMGKTEMKEISAVRTESPEKQGKEGWQTISLKQQASLTSAAPQMGNADYSLHLLYNLIITVIRSTDVYSLEEILKIVDEKDLLDTKHLEEMRYAAAQMLGIQYPIPPIQFDTQVMAKLTPGESEALQKKLRMMDGQREAMIQRLDAVARPMRCAMPGLVGMGVR